MTLEEILAVLHQYDQLEMAGQEEEAYSLIMQLRDQLDAHIQFLESDDVPF